MWKRMYGAKAAAELGPDVKQGCLPPTKTPNKTPRFGIPAGTQVSISRIDRKHDCWQDHTTRMDLGFEKFEKYDKEFKHYHFRVKAWIICVHRSKVVHREDLYKKESKS